MLPYEFHPFAARELDEAVAHYEAIARGKGLELADEIESLIEQICLYPESAPITRGNIPVSYTHLTLPTIYSV